MYTSLPACTHLSISLFTQVIYDSVTHSLTRLIKPAIGCPPALEISIIAVPLKNVWIERRAPRQHFITASLGLRLSATTAVF